MPVHIQAPNGDMVEFPDGTSDEVISSAMQKTYGGPTAPAASAAPSAPKKENSNFAKLVTGEKITPEAKSAEQQARDGDPHVDAATVYTDDMLFGLPGKATAGVQALIRAPFTDKTVGEEYDNLRGRYLDARAQYATDHPIANAAASIGGSVLGGGAAERVAANLIGRAAPGMARAVRATYAGRVAGGVVGSAASGAAQGGLSAYGHDQDVGTGAAIGGAVGGLARPVIAAGSAVLGPLSGLFGIGNQSRANAAIAQALTRSGQAPDDVANAIADGAASGQPYLAADAMGNAGQRMLTGIARAPGDMRQTIAETLQARQAGQGRRLQNALVEGFGTPQTAQQTQDALTALRRADAGVNYPAARAAAGSVDPTSAIAAADNFLGTAGSLPRTGIADDSVEGAVRRARSYLTDGNSVVSDFDTAFRAKRELDNLIETGSNTIRSQIIPIRDALDQSLENASGPYAAARDQFRRQSQDIEAADVGRDAAMRGRVEDTVPRFQAMARPEQQASFRAGYVDPLIEDVQKAPGPMTNKARPLISDATSVEFPAFAAPGQGQQLMDRIGREQRMFETTNAALGGSRTADNAADMADVQGFDPSMIAAFATGGVKGAVLHGLSRGLNAAQGRNQATRDAIARVLLEGDPNAARTSLTAATQGNQRLTQAQESIVRALISGGTAGLTKLAN